MNSFLKADIDTNEQDLLRSREDKIPKCLLNKPKAMFRDTRVLVSRLLHEGK